jgi:DNA-binding NarL/FixJ family response regulator
LGHVITLLIVADIRLYRDGLARVLDRQDQFQVAGTAAHIEGAVAEVRARQPDIVLLDMAMPGSLATARAIMELAPAVKVVALSVAETERDVVACAEAGMAGYVPREGSLADLVAALESVGRGEALCSPRMTASLLRRVAALAATQPSGLARAHLTSREGEVLQLLDGGLANKEIAQRLGIEVATVKNHVHNILEKLQVHRRGEAAARMRGAVWPRMSGPGLTRA